MCALTRGRSLSRFHPFICGLMCLCLPTGALAQGQTTGADDKNQDVVSEQRKDLTDFSLEQLADLQVTTVSRTAQSIGEAPAAIFVITADDMERAGVRSVPAALRLAPNLQVTRLDAASFGISARGFNQSSGTANKLLVLNDGRIVYTPLFSGVFWDEQNAIIEDLDRIEVLSGPGGALWGANAVNGVINIVSRDAHETTGLLATTAASEQSRSLGLRYGGRLGDAAAFRVYGLGLVRDVDDPAEWQNAQAGFRADWGDARDTLTFQGDVYGGGQDRRPGQVSDTEISGGNILARWSRRFSDSSNLEIQAYVDRTERNIASGISAAVNAAAVDAQYDFLLSPNQNVVLGAGVRVTEDEFVRGPNTVLLDPSEETLQTFNVYGQDTIALTPSLDLIAGLKLEHNSYTGLEYLPSVRLAWRPSQVSLAWAAVSRAVRTPSRFDRDLVNPGILNGGADFVSETVIANEVGYRRQVSDRLWYSASAYFNIYDQLRTVEAGSPSVFPLEIRNGMQGNTYGLEAWGEYAVAEGWRLNAGMSLLEKDLKLDAGSADLFGVGFAGNDPEVQASLRSLMDINARTELDLTVRYFSELPDPYVPSYVGIDARLGYRLTDHVEIAIAGYNLADEGHVEFINPSLPARENARALVISARWRS